MFIKKKIRKNKELVGALIKMYRKSKGVVSSLSLCKNSRTVGKYPCWYLCWCGQATWQEATICWEASWHRCRWRFACKRGLSCWDLYFADVWLVRRRKACLVQSVAFQDAVSLGWVGDRRWGCRLFADSRLVRKSKVCLVEVVVGRDDSQQRKFGKSLAK